MTSERNMGGFSDLDPVVMAVNCVGSLNRLSAGLESHDEPSRSESSSHFDSRTSMNIALPELMYLRALSYKGDMILPHVTINMVREKRVVVSLSFTFNFGDMDTLYVSIDDITSLEPVSVIENPEHFDNPDLLKLLPEDKRRPKVLTEDRASFALLLASIVNPGPKVKNEPAKQFNFLDPTIYDDITDTIETRADSFTKCKTFEIDDSSTPIQTVFWCEDPNGISTIHAKVVLSDGETYRFTDNATQKPPIKLEKYDAGWKELPLQSSGPELKEIHNILSSYYGQIKSQPARKVGQAALENFPEDPRSGKRTGNTNRESL